LRDTLQGEIIFMSLPNRKLLINLINQLLFIINAAGIAEILPMAVKMGSTQKRRYM
jgi:hypothetical protein